MTYIIGVAIVNYCVYLMKKKVYLLLLYARSMHITYVGGINIGFAWDDLYLWVGDSKLLYKKEVYLSLLYARTTYITYVGGINIGFAFV
jgi:hypothetical protein